MDLESRGCGLALCCGLAGIMAPVAWLVHLFTNRDPMFVAAVIVTSILFSPIALVLGVLAFRQKPSRPTCMLLAVLMAMNTASAGVVTSGLIMGVLKLMR